MNVCGFCHRGEEAVECGSLHYDKLDGKVIAAHHKCMQYSADLQQYKSDYFGGFKPKKVKKEILRAGRLSCALCKKKGASGGCAWPRCKKGYHFPCAYSNPSTVTKRYKVASGSHTVIMYRVFCSAEHETIYRQNIKGGKLGPGEPDTSKIETPKKSIQLEKDLEKRNHEENEDEDEEKQQKASDKNNSSILRVDPDETATSLNSPKMTEQEVIEETKKEYLKLKEKRKAEELESPEEKRLKLTENRNNNRSESPSLLSTPQRSLRNSPVNDGRSSQNTRKSPASNSAASLNASITPAPSTVSHNTRSSTTKNIVPEGPKPHSNSYDATVSLSPEASETNSEKPDDDIKLDSREDTGIDDDFSEVNLLIPSLLNVPEGEMKAVFKDLGISPEKSVVWPPADRVGSLQEKHLPHLMWSIVEAIRNDNFDDVTRRLTNSSGQEFDYFVDFHTQQHDNVVQQVFHSIAEKLAILNGKQSEKLGQLISRKYQKMKVLVLYLSSNDQSQKKVISCLCYWLFEWSHDTIMRNMPAKFVKDKLEFELLWKWFKFRLKSSFQIGTCPKEEVFINENYSSSVVGKLVDKLSALPHSSSFGSNTSATVLAIDSANRDILRYGCFVQTVIEKLVANSMCAEIFIMIGIDKGDNIHIISDFLPSHLVKGAEVYTAFDPEEAFISCIVVRISKADASTSLPGRRVVKKMSPEQNGKMVRRGSSSSISPVVLVTPLESACGKK